MMMQMLGFSANGWGIPMLNAALTTLILSLAAVLVGAGVGAGLAAAHRSPQWLLRQLAAGYSLLFRGIPELLVIWLFYFGGSGLLSQAGRLFGAQGFIELPPFLIGALAIGLISAAYQGEVYRAARMAIPAGQLEAAAAFGLPRWRIVQRMIVPQVARYALPGLANVWQMSLKDSALVSVTGVVELMRASQVAAGSTRHYFLFYSLGGGAYLLLTLLSGHAFRRAEQRLARAYQSRTAAPH